MARQTAYEVADLRKYLKQLTPEASAELRDASQAIAQRIAEEANGRARGLHPTAQMVAGNITAPRDRVPQVRMSGGKKLPRHSSGRERRGNRQTVANVMWGAEFGGGAKRTTRQFPPWRGNSTDAGYFLWPTVRERGAWMMEQWSAALRDALQKG